jgi:lipopolysaccharide transport system ATP-binding protein
MPSDLAIKVEGVSKKFCRSLKRTLLYSMHDLTRDIFGIRWARNGLRADEFWALKDVSFEVEHGESLGLIGLNGAGKSTLLKLLNGLMLPDKGTITVRGRASALLEVGAGFHPLLTGRENIYLSGAVLGLRKHEIDKKFDAIVDFAELWDFIDTPVKHYSSGMYVRLGFAIAVYTTPDILIIDEALAVGDLGFQHRCISAIRDLRKHKTILFVSHDNRAIINLCDSAIWLNAGHIEQKGSPKLVAERYLEFIYGRNNHRAPRDRENVRPERVASDSSGDQLPYDPQSTLHSRHGRRFGNGRAQIVAVEIVDTARNRYNALWPGCTVNAAIRVRAIHEILQPIVGIEIRDRLGNMIFATNTDQEGICLPRLRAEQSLAVNFIFSWPDIVPGSYSFSPAIADGTQNEHVVCDRVYDALVLEVTSETNIIGLIRIECERVLYETL